MLWLHMTYEFYLKFLGLCKNFIAFFIPLSVENTSVYFYCKEFNAVKFVKKCELTTKRKTNKLINLKNNPT